ncbi:beta-ketoacyl-[acyl-carrier-protein] synthase family protein [Dolichospermum circinale]|uniref:beta-ketoacyl-[acyl-carrier-protein] synthase family protein n=1 Tax=Dolichospermum circinale TaxID=109265 RepID=UPI00232FE0AB|nr:beta-ketoacyl synthase N-terminal-like domain-containing protein [Dolichospermum circinale]MDB9450047.1 beta-ketoacyl synthase N-terminal-like domain-containing protein [Dolichospermum circinale CS-547]
MYNQNRCVISGIGLATPAGSDLETVWQTLAKGTPLFQPLKIFNDEPAEQWVACVDDDQLDHNLSKRQLKKLDRFTILSLAAVKGVLQDSQFPLNDQTRDRLGILMGNCTGGWSYVEPMMYPLYTEGMQAINPYVATAWFPAAPQGEISILYRIGGYSKTIAGERISAGLAFEQSMWLIERQRLDALLVGGAESPLSALVLNAFREDGQISAQNQYRPFSEEADGYLLGEGAAIILLESQEQAQARGAKIYAEVLAVARGMSLEECLRRCLEIAQLSPQDIDYVLLDAFGTPEKDDEEYHALHAVFGNHEQLVMSSPKSMYGNLVGANMALDLALACLSLERQTVLPTCLQTGSLKVPPLGQHVVGKSQPRLLNHILVNGRDHDGQSVVVLLGRPASSPLA